MAVTGVNNYSNIYTNAYTGNIQKNNAKETTEKQVVEQTEDVKTGTTRKTAADELSYLSKKFDNYSFVSANYSPRMKYGKSTTTNVAISPQFLTKMANDSDLEDEYIKEIGNMKKLDEQFAKQQADIGWRVEQGWAIDKDGNISSWAIGHKDSKVKSFLQNMSEKAEEIQQKQLEKAKDTKEEKEVFSMKKHKEVFINSQCSLQPFMLYLYLADWSSFFRLCKMAPKSDIIVLVATFFLTVFFDLVVAIEIGVVLAALLFMKRMAETADIKAQKYTDSPDITPGEAEKLRDIPHSISVFEICGPMFFAAADQILNINSNHHTKVVVIRMRSVPAIDASAMRSLHELANRAKRKNITLVFSHVNEQPMRVMEKDGFIGLVGKENFHYNIVDALDYAEALVK